MSNQTLHALCFYISGLDPRILFAFDAMTVQRILQLPEVEDEPLFITTNLQSKEDRLFARFFNGKQLRLGEGIKFTVLKGEYHQPIPNFLTGWARQHCVTSIYHQDNCFYLLLASPDEGDSS